MLSAAAVAAAGRRWHATATAAATAAATTAAHRRNTGAGAGHVGADGSAMGRGGRHSSGPSRQSKHTHLHLNRRILACETPAALGALVAARAADFNHVNVATAFRHMMMAQHGNRPGVEANALQTLEESALQKIGEFEAREVANLLHIMAKRGYRPAHRSLPAELDRRAEALAADFTPQVSIVGTPHACVCVRARVRLCLYAPQYIYTYMHTTVRVCLHAHTHSHTNTHTHTNTRTHTISLSHTNKHVHTNSRR